VGEGYRRGLVLCLVDHALHGGLDRRRFQRRPAEGRARAAQGLCLGGLLFPDGIGGLRRQPGHAGCCLIARTVQGYGGGLLLAQSMGLISELYPPALRTRILAMVSGVGAVAALVGPLVGGIFAEFGWWRGAFWASTPIILWFTAGAWQTAAARHDGDGGAALPRFRRIALLALGVLCAGRRDQCRTCGAASCRLPELVTQGLLLVASARADRAAFRLDGTAANRLFAAGALGADADRDRLLGSMFLFSMTHTSIGTISRWHCRSSMA